MSSFLQPLARNRVLQVIAYVLIWTALGMISATQSLLSYAAAGDQPSVWLVVRFAMPTWYAWAIVAPLIYVVARRLPLDGGKWRRNLPVHLLFNAVVLVLAALLVGLVRQAFNVPLNRSLNIELISSINTALFTYWIVVLVAHGVGYYQEHRAGQVRAAELSAQLSQARLEALQAQLHPHFLFNTMHAISAFVREEPEKAETMLAELAELLRLSMDGSGEQVVPLERELEFVRRYLSIQKTRLGDRLDLSMEVAKGVEAVPVPALVLQPLVENAVEHGIAKRLGEGRVWIRVRPENGNLLIDVVNDGPEVPAKKLDPASWRVGLRNTGDRLEQLYGSDGRLELLPRTEGGLQVRVSIPLEAPRRTEDS